MAFHTVLIWGYMENYFIDQTNHTAKLFLKMPLAKPISKKCFLNLFNKCMKIEKCNQIVKTDPIKPMRLNPSKY